ncbi:MAG: hypothetical protein RJA63_3012, partial [Pseudomonadota bacterium]
RVIVKRTSTGEVVAQAELPYLENDPANGVLQPAQFVSRQAVLHLPEGVSGSGDLQVIVTTDASNMQTEIGKDEENNSASLVISSALKAYANLKVEELLLTPGGSWQAGDVVSVSWRTANAGSAAAAGSWMERVELVNLTTGVVVASLDLPVREQNIESASSVERRATFKWPGGINAIGTFRLRVTVDALSQVAEFDETGAQESDNTQALEVAVGPDLVVKNARVLSPQVQSGDKVTVVWDDVNEGDVAVPRSWQDRVVVRPRLVGGGLGDPVFNTLVSFPEDLDRPLAAGASRTRSFTFKLPDGKLGTGDFEISVHADSSATSTAGVIFETRAGGGDAEANNTATTAVHGDPRIYPDLVTSNVIVSNNIQAGVPFDVSWTVKNNGTVPAASASGWIDRVYLSSDDVFGNVDDIAIGSLPRKDALAAGEAYTASLTVKTPTRIEGNYRLIVVADADRAVIEPDTRADNLVISSPIIVSRTYVDLQPAFDHVPTQANAGGNLRVEWSVKNLGTVASDASSWVDQIWLSATPELGADAILLGSSTHVGSVEREQAYSALADLTLPKTLVGAYYLIVKTDAFSANYELEHTTNNLAVSTSKLVIGDALRPNLTLIGIEAPDVAEVGKTLDVSYTVKNTGDVAVNAWIADSVKLVAVDDKTQTISPYSATAANRVLAPGESYAAVARFRIPDVISSKWEIQISTDSGKQIGDELDVTDNQAIRPLTIAFPDVSVDQIITTGTLRGGETVDVSWVTHNLGSLDAATITDALYLSRDGKLEGALKLGEYVHEKIATASESSAKLSVLIPVDAGGRYQLLVATDVKKLLAETAEGEKNNLGAKEIDVVPDQYADLSVSDVIVPSQIIQDPASVTVRWTVHNTGTGPGRTDAWTDVVVFSEDNVLGNRDDIVIGNVRHEGGLEVGKRYTGETTYRFAPEFAARGHVFVKTDGDARVWENASEDNNVAQASNLLDVMPIPYADLQMQNVVVEGTPASGKPLKVSWEVANNGIGVTDSATWSDTVWLSKNADGSDVVASLGSVSHFGQIEKGGRYTHSLSVVLPQGLSGTYYVNVEANAGGSAFEFVHYSANNRGKSVSVSVSLSPTPDLYVQDIRLPAEAKEGSLIDVSWDVINLGGAEAKGIWADRVLLIPLDGTGTPIVLGEFNYDRTLEAGKQYTRTEQFRLPTRIHGAYRVKVVTNAKLDSSEDEQIYEHGEARKNNETLSSGHTTVSLNPRPDLRVKPLTVPDAEIIAGGSVQVKYEVENMGSVSADGHWQDAVYLSLDGTLSADDTLLGRFENVSALAPTRSYSNLSATVDIPIRFRDTAYLIVVADANFNVDEYPNDPNNATAVRIDIKSVPLADLVTSDVVAPTQAVHGASIDVNYRVTNRGSATTRGERATLDSWTDTIWLAKDKLRPGAYKGDILLGSVTHKGNLAVGEDYLGSTKVQIPDDVYSGQYYVTVWSDSYDVILEDTLASNINEDDPKDNDNNNYKARAIDILGIQPPDLVVSEMSALASAAAAGDYTFSYTVKNIGDMVSGKWFDSAYLTDDPDLTKAKKVFWLGSF